MTHTSTEQPEALPTPEAVMEQAQVFASAWALYGSGSILEPEDSAELAVEEKEKLAVMVLRLHARVVELEFAREIARACTHNINTAAQSQRVPLSEKQVEDLIYAKHFRKCCAQLSYASTQVNLNWYRLGLRDGERAHGITQEKQG